MAVKEISRGRSTKYSDTLDELLGIRDKKENMFREDALLDQAEPMERPTTRHGRNREAVPAVADTESSSSYLKPDIFSKSGVVVERWQRESEEGDYDEDGDEDSSSERNSKNERKGETTRKASLQQEIETTKNYDAGTVPSKQETPSPPTNGTAKFGSRSRRSIDSIDDKCNSDRSKKTARQLSQSSVEFVERDSVTKSRASTENSSRDTFRIRSISATPKNKAGSKVKKSVRKHSATTVQVLDESSSAGKSAYEAWLREKLKKEKEKRCIQKEKEEEERKAKEERKKEAEKNYEIWKQRTDEALREKRRKEKEKADALNKEKKEERKRKNEEATKMFQAWKNDQLQRLSAERKERLQEKENEALKKKYENETKINDAQKAFSAWCEEKKIRDEEAQHKLLESRRTQETQSRNEKEYKEALAKEAYDVWLQLKENERRFNESLQGRIMKFDETARRLHPVPWIPPSNVVPRQFVSTRPRRHQSAKRSTKINTTSHKKLIPSASNRSKSAHR